MNTRTYQKEVNKNTLVCWLIIITVLSISYILEIIKGNRTITYVLLFLIFCIIPFVITFIAYYRNKSADYIKYLFSIGYCIFYTYAMVTANGPVNFVYILPMSAILLSYADLLLIICTFTYSVFLSIFCMIGQIFEFIPVTYVRNIEERIVVWEIQIAALILTGLFCILSSRLLIKKNQLIENLSEEVYRDGLTGLYNLSYLNEKKQTNYKYLKNDYLAIAFIDIDDFKNFNTVYGHSFGDIVLQTFADILQQQTNIYKDTYAYRIGGDEFIIVTETLRNDDFIQFLNGITLKISEICLDYQEYQNIHISISTGVAFHFELNTYHFKDLYNLADKRNQKAKETGKNRVLW